MMVVVVGCLLVVGPCCGCAVLVMVDVCRLLFVFFCGWVSCVVVFGVLCYVLACVLLMFVYSCLRSSFWCCVVCC